MVRAPKGKDPFSELLLLVLMRSFMPQMGGSVVFFGATSPDFGQLASKSNSKGNVLNCK